MDFSTDFTASRSSAGRSDLRGCPASTASPAAIDHVEQALQSMLSYFGDPMVALDAAIDADPAWAYPHTLKASLLLTTSEYGPSRDAKQLLERARELSGTANPRERAHIGAALAAAGGDWDRACELWEAILVEWPRDVAALLFAHLFDFYRGDALNLKRRPERVLTRWTPDMPLYGFVLGMAAFGQEESGHYEQAEDTGRAALSINPRDPWAVHAVTHVYEMQGRYRAGAHWLESRQDDWAIDNGFAFHNWFHAALFHLEDLDTAAALDVYDRHLAGSTDIALQRIDGTAILWRLKLLGVDVASRFAALRRTWETEAPAAGFYAFNDLHALVACIGAGEGPQAGDGADALMAAMTMPASGGVTNQRMTTEVGLPLARAFGDYANGRFAAAAEGLLQVRDRAHRFGGSHAQRDILTLTLLDAAARSGNRPLARHILAERHSAKGTTPLTMHWDQRIAAAA